MATKSTSSQSTSDYKLDMSTSYLLKQITDDVPKFAPTAEVSISPDATWTEALAVASKSLKDQDQATLIFPETSKERREAIKKLALSEKSRPSSASIGRSIRTSFPTDITPPPARPGTKERSQTTLILEVIDGAEEDDNSATCKLVVKDMLWDTGSHGCTITDDLLPQNFSNRLAQSDNDPYRDEFGAIVQVQGYLALSNSIFFFFREHLQRRASIYSREWT
ncbi:uncharacterized protein Z518_04995 [Rhinocladiella mackenziei CBS 650.93]|uniref:Uncharacterized protein n=1 Tax=Rhinocladiella mackenziei CBS 650.93 TaxID=1442369 RepID=A0A0D2IMP2_9EURO|nr:uncharacterized protein Z518_04995 [Rhinocladiella mackenziei CBS 650.93]KIX07019.1 hypothetical protein Z518_04995 [Rhinocladiella mackenziei CBS 650.93]